MAFNFETITPLMTPITSTEYQNSESFKAWFKDSKVVDSNNNPIAVYHGTIDTFNTFITEPIEKKSYYGFGQSAIGAFFSESFTIAKSYPGNWNNPELRKVISVHLAIKNPAYFATLQALGEEICNFANKNGLALHFGQTLATIQVYKEYLKELGYDGITFYEGPMHNPSKDQARVWVAFSPEQIKSTQNVGTFDNKSSNIYL